MKWENINLHIENLIPGIVSLILVLSFLPEPMLENVLSNQYVDTLIKNRVSGNIFFLCTSYLLGIFVVILSRFIIDPISEQYLRPLLLKLLLSPENKDKMKSWDFDKINTEYRSAIKIALESENEAVKSEVAKRRERGRLLRTTFIPIMLVIFAFSISKNLRWQAILPVIILVSATLLLLIPPLKKQPYWRKILLILLIVIILIIFPICYSVIYGGKLMLTVLTPLFTLWGITLLYAYSEVCIYKECLMVKPG